MVKIIDWCNASIKAKKTSPICAQANIIHALLAVISEAKKWMDFSQLFSSVCFGYFQILVTATSCMPCFVPCIDIDQIRWTIVIYIGTHVIFLLHHHFYFNWIFCFTTFPLYYICCFFLFSFAPFFQLLTNTFPDCLQISSYYYISPHCKKLLLLLFNWIELHCVFVSAVHSEYFNYIYAHWSSCVIAKATTLALYATVNISMH